MFTCDFLIVYQGKFRLVTDRENARNEAPDPDHGVYVPILDSQLVPACMRLVACGRKPIEVLASARVAMDLRQLSES